jgi:hypothetical protein
VTRDARNLVNFRFPRVLNSPASLTIHGSCMERQIQLCFQRLPRTPPLRPRRVRGITAGGMEESRRGCPGPRVNERPLFSGRFLLTSPRVGPGALCIRPGYRTPASTRLSDLAGRSPGKGECVRFSLAAR